MSAECEHLLAAVEAERNRCQLLLDINNAVVTRLDLASMLHATSDSLRKVIPHDSRCDLALRSGERQLRLHTFDLQYASDGERR